MKSVSTPTSAAQYPGLDESAETGSALWMLAAVLLVTAAYFFTADGEPGADTMPAAHLSTESSHATNQNEGQQP